MLLKKYCGCPAVSKANFRVYSVESLIVTTYAFVLAGVWENTEIVADKKTHKILVFLPTFVKNPSGKK